VGTSHFARGTAVGATGDGRYRADVGEEWNCPAVPHGGLMTATAARAMTAELADPSQVLRTITTVFAAPVAHGDIDIDVTLLRRGRTMSQLTASTRNPGAAAGHMTVAAFGAPRPGFSFTDIEPPNVPPPDECRSFRDPLPEEAKDFDFTPMNFWNQIEGRPVIDHAPWEHYEITDSLHVVWQRFDDPPLLDDGRWDPLALVTLCDAMPGAVDERLGPNVVHFMPPSVDLTVHLLGDARSEWVLCVNRARHAGNGYASADLEIWDMDDEPTLCAYGTQVMFFVFPNGLPPMATDV
jgi:acyl-CoA thioesterase